ncbi:RICIN domain-containing protein, partial [Streptomyces sp. NPDC001269]
MNTKKVATLAAALMFVTSPVVAQAATSSTPASQGELTYQLVNVQTGKCATVAGGRSTANNIRLVQFSCDTDPSRRWRLTNWNGSSYQLVNVQTSKCATVAGGRSTANNIRLVQFSCDTDPSRRWRR